MSVALLHELEVLVAEHGSNAVLTAFRDACENAAQHQKGTSAEDSWFCAECDLDKAIQNVADAESCGVTLDMSLSVLADLAESIESEVAS